jgi:aspartokinase/homoserine dehydrogenase 2
MSVIAQAGAKGRQLHKFGGSSLADVKCYLRVAGIMTEYSQPGDMMVVSAAGSTTNQLISWLKLSQTDRLSAHQVQQSLRRYQSELIAGLLPADVADGLISAFTHDLERLAALLDSGITDAVYAEVVGHGEVWSARLMAAVLQHLVWTPPGSTRVISCAPNAPRSRRWMKGCLIRCCNSCWCSIPANALW